MSTSSAFSWRTGVKNKSQYAGLKHRSGRLAATLPAQGRTWQSVSTNALLDKNGRPAETWRATRLMPSRSALLHPEQYMPSALHRTPPEIMKLDLPQRIHQLIE